MLTIGSGVGIVLVLPALASRLDFGYHGGQYALGSYGATWLLSFLVSELTLHVVVNRRWRTYRA